MPDLIRKIRKKVVNAVSDYHMLKAEDKVLVAVSGGIDSTVLLVILNDIARRAPFPFTLEPVLVDHKFPGIQIAPFAAWIRQLGFELTILDCETYPLVEKSRLSNQSPCLICSRLRRGALYTYARKHGFNKIALGHNRDDLNETLLLNMFYSGRLAGMPPKLKADDGCNTLIRPLCLVPKHLIASCAIQLGAPVIENTYCNEMPDNARVQIRNLLRQLEVQNPKIAGSLLGSQGKIIPSQLMDKRFWDFDG